MLGRSRHSPIGVSITSTRLHAAQLRVHGRDATPHRTVALPRLNPGGAFDAAEATRLRDVLTRQGFVGGDCVVALPNGELIRSLVEVSGKEQDVVVKAAEEVERTHNLKPGSYELAAWLPQGATGRRTTAVCVSGCKHDAAERLLTTFASAGLELVALDSRACAVSRVIDDAAEFQSCVTAVLDLDHAGAELVMLSGGQVLYQRPLLDVGLDQAARRLMDAGLDKDTAVHFLKHHGLASTDHAQHNARLRQTLLHYMRSLVSECQPALDYVTRLFTALPIERFAMVGDGCDVPVLEYELRQHLRLNPAEHTPTPLRGHGNDHTFAVAVGLALHPQEATWAAA